MLKDFAKRLRTARSASGLTQAELAGRLRLAAEAYGRLERGHALPSAETLVRLSRVLRISADELLGLPGPPALSQVTEPDAEYVASRRQRLRRIARQLERLMKELIAELDADG